MLSSLSRLQTLIEQNRQARERVDMAATGENGEIPQVPLSEQAQEHKEMMQQELMRSMASKLMAAALEEERERRIAEMQDQGGESDDAVRKKAYGQLVVVQEDLIRTLNLMKVSKCVLKPFRSGAKGPG